MDSDWFGGATVSKDPWDTDTMWDKDAMWGKDAMWDNTQKDTKSTEHPISLRSLDSNFINNIISLKHHCYDITVLQVPLDSDDAQSMVPLQNYITMLSTIYAVLMNAPYDTKTQKLLPASVQEKMAPLLEWIRQFCETNRDPSTRLPFQSYLRMNIIENPYVQSKIIE